jgi:hypothetical protein
MAKRPDYSASLTTPKNAYFFSKLKPLSKALIERVFHSAMKQATGNALQRVIRKTAIFGARRLKYSFLLFREESEPAFLDGTDLRNVEHCFLLIVELASTIAVFKCRSAFSGSDLERCGALPDHGDVSRLFMHPHTAYERIGMRMMNFSRDGIHRRSLEAPDLTRSMSTLGANRAIPTEMRVKVNDDVHSVAPSTGRVSKRDARSSLRQLMQWAIQMEQEFTRPKPNNGFIDHFARPMKLSARPAGVEPSGVIFTLAEVEAGLEAGTLRRILRRNWKGQLKEVDNTDLTRLFNTVRDVFSVEQSGGQHWLYQKANRRQGELRLNKNSISIAGSLLRNYFAERTNGEQVALPQLMNRSQDFLVCFSNPRYAYFGGHLFHDQNLLNQIDGFLSIFVPVAQLAAVTSEKGALAANSTQFPNDSVFGVIHQTIATGDDFLVCDDLGDEWADEIGVCTAVTNPAVSFYVAKHDVVGLSASAFHDAVGQAQKNLGHVNPIPAELLAKLNKWGQLYNAITGATQIQRVLKGASAGAAVTAIETVLAMPNAQRRMCLVISFISKNGLTAALTQLKNAGNGDCQLIQMLWLVTAFISACRDAGAVPLIYCAP